QLLDQVKCRLVALALGHGLVFPRCSRLVSLAVADFLAVLAVVVLALRDRGFLLLLLTVGVALTATLGVAGIGLGLAPLFLALRRFAGLPGCISDGWIFRLLRDVVELLLSVPAFPGVVALGLPLQLFDRVLGGLGGIGRALALLLLALRFFAGLSGRIADGR